MPVGKTAGHVLSGRAVKYSRTIGYFAAFVGLGMVVAVLGPTLSGLAEHTKTQLSEISFLFTAHALGYLLGSLFIGRLFDRLPGHFLIAAVLLITALMMAMVPLIPFLWILIVVLLILGMCGGSLDVGGNLLLIWVHRREVGPFMNALHFFFGLGAFLSPVIIAQTVLMSGDITWGYWLIALLILPVAIWLVRLPSPSIQSEPDNDLRGKVNIWLVILIAFFFLFIVGAEVSFGGWIFTYAVSLGLAIETAAALLTSVFWGSFTVGRLLSIPIAARVRPHRVLFVDFMACLVSLIVIMLFPNSPVALWLGSFGVGLSMASMFPTMLTLAEKRLAMTGKVTSWFFVGSSVGSMTMPWLVGQLFEFGGPWVMMLIVLANVALGFGAFVIIIRKERN